MSTPFTQTKEYLKWHEAVGTKTFYKEFFVPKRESIDFQIDQEKEKELASVCASVILDLKIGRVLYVPYGPVFLLDNAKVKNDVFDYLKKLALEENCVFVRIEEENKYLKTPPSLPLLRGGTVRPPKKVFSKEGIFQPRVEWWLDLGEEVDAIYNRIHKDHKYSIRRAEREGVKVEIVSENFSNYFEIFWNLLQETGKRDGFKLYEENYYREIFSAENKKLKKFLVFTKFEDKYLSVALVVIKEHIANLVFAGSTSQMRELGFNHLMQWQAICESKKQGCNTYNFGGIHSDNFGKKTLLGVTLFKKKFGGYAKFHGGFIDIPVKKTKYFLYILKKLLSV